MSQPLSALPINAKVKDLTSLYYGQPIVWRLVDKNHTGYPANSVTVIADKILCGKAFDALEEGNSNASRRIEGNNRYLHSNLRRWLNSEAAAWYAAQHGADAPPTAANVWKNHNPYDTEPGFMAGLSAAFRFAILPTTRTVVKNRLTDGGGTESVTDKLFLASVTEIGLVNDGVAEGTLLAGFSSDSSRIAFLTAEAVANSTYAFNPSKAWYYWLSTPLAENSFSACQVGSNGTLGYNAAHLGIGCVRPLCNLKSDVLVSDTADTDGVYTIVWNSAPSMPPSISVPSNIAGGTNTTVSWGAATDPDGNLLGYILERSTNGGTSWVQMYQGGAISTADFVPFGTPAVMYRVKAYDTYGAQSAYQISGQVTVTNNRAPSAPASISVPNTVEGGKALTVSWGAATDPDGNLSGYALERSTDGGANWAQIYTGSALSYTDSITKGWGTVTYRARAFDSYGAYSAYTTSTVRTVINNTAPAIACDTTSMGVISEGFDIPYQVTDVDSDAVTITEAVDNITLRSFAATLGADNHFTLNGKAFMLQLNGGHTLKITANDGKASTSHTISLTKAVTSLGITLTAPMLASTPITVAALAVLGSIPADAVYKIEVTNNALDDTPVWQDCTAAVTHGANIVFDNTVAAKGYAFNFRLTASRGSSGQGGYITSIQGGYQ